MRFRSATRLRLPENRVFFIMLHFINLVVFKAMAELHAENSRMMAGYAWWILEPIMTLGVYYAVFSYLRQGTENFALFLLTGIVFWRWFQATVMRASNSITANRGLMLQVDVRKALFPLTAVLVDSVKFAVTFALLVIVVLASGDGLTYAWLSLPVLLASQLLLIAGVSMLTSATIPLIPDFSLILNTLMMLTMFCSAVFYPMDILPLRVQSALQYNPMAVLISQYRIVFLSGNMPSWHEMSVVWGWTLLSLAMGGGILWRLDRYYPKIS